MSGTWEVRLYGIGPAGRCQRTYRLWATCFTAACQRAKLTARAEGIDAPCVWAATHQPTEETDQ